MPYSPTHKERTRGRIVGAASRLVRRLGVEGASVGAAMSDAGLTHGGFYAHFADKTALVRAAIDAAFDESDASLFGGALATLRGDEWVERASERHLSMSHRDARADGCAIPAIGAEVARGDRSVRGAFARRVESVVTQMSERLGGDRQRAIRLLATWSGALLLARIAPSRAAAREILDAARAAR